MNIQTVVITIDFILVLAPQFILRTERGKKSHYLDKIRVLFSVHPDI